MSKIKKLTKLVKNISPMSKKVVPVFNNVMNTIDLLEHTSAIAKPYFDDMRSKNIENSKKIYAVQYYDSETYKILIQEANIEAQGETQNEAFEKFISCLSEFRENKVLSSDKKIQKEQMKLIQKLNSIAENEEDIKRFIFRVEGKLENAKDNSFNFILDKSFLKRK